MNHNNLFGINQTGFSGKSQNIICHQYYVEQPFSPPVRKSKCQARTIDKTKFSTDPSNTKMVTELTELIPQLSQEIKNMNRDQFMETYTLAMHERKKAEQFKSNKKKKQQTQYQNGSKTKSQAMEKQVKEDSKQKYKTQYQCQIPQEKTNPKRTHDSMMSTNPSKTRNDQSKNNELMKETKYQKTNSPFERQLRKIKIPQKLTRQININQQDDDFVMEEESKGHKRIHDEDYEVCKKTRYQNSHKTNQTPTSRKDPKEYFRKTKPQ